MTFAGLEAAIPPGWHIAGTPILRREATLCRLEQAGSAPLALKQFNVAKLTSKNLPEHYFNALQTCYLARDAAGNAAPQPHALLADHGAVLMEWVQAPLASQLLMHAPHSARTRRDVIARAARWLRWFHSCFPSKPKPCDYATIATIFKPGQAPSALLTRAHSLLQQSALRLPKTLLQHGVMHGDFTPCNLFLDTQRTVGIDFTLRRQGPHIADISRFLLYLSIYRLRAVSTADIKNYGCARADWQCFAEHYAGGLADIPQPVLRWLNYAQMLRRFASIEASGIHRGSLKRRLEYHRLRRMVRILTTHFAAENAS